MSIGYAIAQSPLGHLMVAATGRGICRVGLADSVKELRDVLAEEFPRADVKRDEATLRPMVDAVLAGLEGNRPSPALPLDVQATAFQWRVWQELQKIPRGRTRSYGEIARAVGAPGAARAVGQACNRNPVALVIPCHRVVGGDGALGGYRWGVERKRTLLEAEGALKKS